MSCRIVLGILLVVLLGCNDNRQNNTSQATEQMKTPFDTIVGKKVLTDEIAGSAYRKRAIGYFVIVGNDTSDFACIFTESKSDGKVWIDLNIPYFKKTMTYSQRLKELKMILPKAALDFNFDSLTGISYGRLILSGDLAIDVTNQYRQRFGTSDKLQSYDVVRQFLKESKLGTDLNTLFKDYSITVDNVYPEKLFFTKREDLYWASMIGTDSSDVPGKILDCMTNVKLSKK
ncbi:MAG: hypothetical protein NVV82_11945 [Sporocytophaga sp.]|nr:hypothetical protein [Sporocytophaga sp.]